MGIFKECKDSPNGRHLWKRWKNEHGHVVIHCHWCGRIHK